MTAALEVGEWSAARPGRTLPPGKTRYPFYRKAGWAPQPVWTGGKSRSHRNSIPDCPAHNHSLYRLSYRAHVMAELYICIIILFVYHYVSTSTTGMRRWKNEIVKVWKYLIPRRATETGTVHKILKGTAVLRYGYFLSHFVISSAISRKVFYI